MKERPIIFSTDMVRAILDGRKSQTRRVINDKVMNWIHEDKFVHVENPVDGIAEVWWDVIRGGPTSVDQDYAWIKCPYGKPGDLLYVRETFCQFSHKPVGMPIKTDFAYKADDEFMDQKWKPSIHMPKKAARIWLEVKDIRVERVQDITTNDIKAEGVQIPVNDNKPLIPLTDKHFPHGYLKIAITESGQLGEEEFFKAFWIKLWNSINEKRGFGWEENPFCWVVEFEVLSTNGRPG